MRIMALVGDGHPFYEAIGFTVYDGMCFLKGVDQNVCQG